jgi:beta-barrel assembly-enhancing protease
MKRFILYCVFFLILGTALASLYYTQRHEKQTHVSANAILDMAADAQRDLTRAPMHFTRLSDDEEISIGRDLSAQYDSKQKPLAPEEQALSTYMQRVGSSISLHAHRRLPYSFHLVPDRNLINAFSLPGGSVYVGEGMLDQLMAEDELASLLAHEIEHIDHYHCVERVQIEANLKHFNLGALGDVVKLPVELWQTGYHKDEELEADREGMSLAVRAGYSPYGQIQLFQRLAKLHNEYVIHAESPEEELSELAIKSLSGYFRSHPLPSERIAQSEQIIVQQHWEDRKETKPFRLGHEVPNGQFVK